MTTFWRVEIDFETAGAPSESVIKRFVLDSLEGEAGAQGVDVSGFKIRYVHSATTTQKPTKKAPK